MTNVFGRPLPNTLALCLLTLFTATNIFTQDLDEVTISGKIIDSNSLAIVGATVTATLGGTGIQRKVETDQSGRYRIIELRPGTYTIKAGAQGFGPKIRSGLETIAGQNVRLNFTLDPATIIVEPVEVSADTSPPIDTTRMVVGGTLTETEIEELPNSSNDILDLVYTLGGTAEEPFSIDDLADDDRIGGGSERDQPSEVLGAGNISLAGGAAYSTNITIDGLDNNDDRAAEERFQPPPDAVAEVQVIANQFSAEYGRASGGRINIRTRAGARKLRGRAFLFFEDDGLNANTYNNNRRGLARLPFAEYNPGGTLGGPVPFGYFKERTYFFSSSSYQTREADTQIFSALPVERNPRYPLPAPTETTGRRRDFDDDLSPFIAPYIVRTKTPARRLRFTQRIDHNFSDRHNITFNYQFGRSDSFRQYRETTRFLEETLQGRVRNNDSFYLTDNFVFNSKAVNQFRFQFSNYRPDFGTRQPLDPVVLLSVRDETFDGHPDQVRGTVVIGNSTSNFASVRKEKRYQFQETLNLIGGAHNFRIGADVQRIESTTSELTDATGTFNFNRVGDFLNNQPGRFRRRFGTGSTLINNYVGVFFQNDWRLRSDLTLSFGLRYERETLVVDKNNFGPRLALAYSPGTDERSVIRIGGGIFYNRALLRTIADFRIDSSVGSFDSRRLSGPAEDVCLTEPANPADKCVFLRYLAAVFPAAPTEAEILAIPGIIDLDRGFVRDNSLAALSRQLEPGIKIPESYQFNIGYERDLGGDFVFEANFTFNKAVRLWREQNINAHLVPGGFRDFTEYLLSLGAVTIPGTTSGTDTYIFELGDPTDPNGDRNAETGADCNSSTPLCIVNLNTLNGSEATLEPIGIALRVLDALLDRPVTNSLRQLEQVGSRGRSIYEGLALELRRRFRGLGFGFGGSMRFSYVLSRTRDDGFVDTSSAQIRGDFASEFSRSGIDRRHKFRFSGLFELPDWLGRLRLAPILRIETGRPFNISNGGSDRNLDDVGNDRPNYAGDPGDIVYRGPNEPFPADLAGRFSVPPIGSGGGDLPRNAGHGPALFVFDLNVSRRFRITDRIRIRPQISFDNILNASVFSFGSDFINLANAATPEFEQGFLVPSRTLRQRRIQLGVRIDF